MRVSHACMKKRSISNSKYYKVKFSRFELKGVDYALNPATNEEFDYDSYKYAEKTGGDFTGSSCCCMVISVK